MITPMTLTPMTLTISRSGTYDILADTYNNISIEAPDVILNGNNYTVYGWIHVNQSRVTVNQLTFKPTTLLQSEPCELCSAVSVTSICPSLDSTITSSVGAICRDKNGYNTGIYFRNCTFISPCKLDCDFKIVDTTAIIYCDNRETKHIDARCSNTESFHMVQLKLKEPTIVE